jgi:hypothetical protein
MRKMTVGGKEFKVTRVVAVEMECQAHHDEDKRAPAGYLASMLSEMQGGSSLYLPYIPPPGDRGKSRRRMKLARETAVLVFINPFVHYFALV